MSSGADKGEDPGRGLRPRMSTPPTAIRQTPPAAPQTGGAQRRHNEGHGRRLTAAFEALEAFPALAESRNRLLRLVSQERISADRKSTRLNSSHATISYAVF